MRAATGAGAGGIAVAPPGLGKRGERNLKIRREMLTMLEVEGRATIVR